MKRRKFLMIKRYILKKTYSVSYRIPLESGACNEHNLEKGKTIDDIELKITREDQQLNF